MSVVRSTTVRRTAAAAVALLVAVSASACEPTIATRVNETRGAAGRPMFSYEDDETGFTSDDAFQTCAAVRKAGNTCDFVLQPGEGHTAWLTPGAPFWTTQQGPFLWTQLRLG